MTNKLPEVEKKYRKKGCKYTSAKVISIEEKILIRRDTYDSTYLDEINLEGFWSEFEELPGEQEEESILVMNGSHKDNLERKDNSNQIEVEKTLDDACAYGTGFISDGKRIDPREIYKSPEESEVEKAKEELKKELRSEYNAWGSLTELGQAAQNLLNALDSQKEDKTDMKEESVNDLNTKQERFDALKDRLESGQIYFPETPTWIAADWAKDVLENQGVISKSIWKDVSELPEENHENWHYLVRWDNGEVELNGFDVNDRCFNYLDGTTLCNSEIVEFCTLTDFVAEHKQTKELVEQNTKRLDKLELLIKG